uniref:Polyketide synthase-like methyltransferase domain-containing protein n=1 Tax=Tetradesmus obliquus TaxID=3088 RepID=A0A383VI01_TETOB|eukprot:jgi/Sobl393_1/17219/SZX65148.1
MDGATTSVQAAHLYNGVDALWKVLFGSHIHVGYYPTADRSARLADAQEHTIDKIIATAGLTKSGVRQLLDVGCGVGGTSIHIAKKLGCRALGVNISPDQVASANELALQQGLLPSQVRFVVGDGLDLPQSVGTADVVLSFESACYMPDKRRFVQQLASRVQPGGKLVLVDFCRGPDALNEEQAGYLRQMDQLFKTAGDWHSMQEYLDMLREEGLTVTCCEDWSGNIRGFWEANLVELFSVVPETTKQGQLSYALAVIKKLLLTGALVVAGGWPTLKMAGTFLLAMQQRIVGGAFSSGALRYQCVVAVKK